ncbi:hypothetical protein CEP52_007658 [Fusarium oligoseptatum]|uniref:Splicing factor 1 helix-hairpin domain-containing protein n=1 Tax=Fusarium oligoseptatum TaxID=2604345 RepID=A0A428TLX0_9HYPO|nr:hypothetical protein CEP52_007658 [Fusarium oligoseptatum]
MTSKQLDAYVVVFRIDEITEQLRSERLDSTNRPWSPSPPPEHGSNGRRTNTWEKRNRWRLEEKRHQLEKTVLRTIPAYRLPHDYRRSMTKGLPSSSRLSTRQIHRPDPRELLHSLITADSQIKVDKARKIIQDVIETATSTSKHANKRKVYQLRDLTRMNGTFWDDKSQYHRGHPWHLPEAPQDDQPATNSYRHPVSQNNGSALHQEYQQFRTELDIDRSLSSSDGVHASFLQEAKLLPQWRTDQLKGWSY